jgi:UDP-galactopyranose mutase
MIDYLIVGAGLFGAVCARELADSGRSVLVIDKRSHIGGNCYTETWDGITTSLYGGHIFHTNSRRIWDYVNEFAEWQQYEHRVKASYKGVVYSFPPNRMTIQQIGAIPGSLEDEIKRRFFEGYTAKQWGRPLAEVPDHVIKRIPIRDNWDDRYFTDLYQGLPMGGYTPMFERLLNGIEVELQADYMTDLDYWRSKAEQVIYTGPLDELYWCNMGRLKYRSLRHEHQLHAQSDFLGCATLNYADLSIPYTRKMEWKHFWRASTPYTWVTTEYPQAYDGTNEPYYPVGDEPNRALYQQYKEIAKQNGYIVGGRLGSYQYLNMDQAIGAALATVERLWKS